MATPPMSPDYCRPYPSRHDSIESVSSSSSLSSLSSLYSPRTPPNLNLPPLEKLLPVPEGSYFSSLSSNSASSVNSSPVLSSVQPATKEISPSSTRTPANSVPSSPKSGAANPVVKRTSRRYTCQCGKSFTTSGHLARHTRIHTGEKNYVCPEAGCGARFSRQDNCMQHYRTHQSGSASKRAARKRRMSAGEVLASEPVEAVRPELHPRMHTYHSPQPISYSHYSDSFGGESGLNALASVAISGYP